MLLLLPDPSSVSWSFSRLSLTFDTVCTEADATQVVHSVPGAGARGRWEAVRA